jgi:hypothetical protein
MDGRGYRYRFPMTLPGRSRTIVVEPVRAPAKEPAPAPPPPKEKPAPEPART